MKLTGHSTIETHRFSAGDPGGQETSDTQTTTAARRKSKTKTSAGQRSLETQIPDAGEPGGHQLVVTQSSRAARRKSKIAGHVETETHAAAARNGGADRGHFEDETQGVLASVRATVDILIEVGRRNDFAIRQRMRIRQATLSHIARSEFGYHTHLTDAERKKTMDAATKLVKAIRAGQEHALGMLVRATDLAAAPWEEIQTGTEKEMVKLARHLPAYEWVQGVRGFGALSFARIIAETGDLSGYANPSKVWKRMGLAVFDGHAQRRTRDAEKAVKQGYSPRRRATSWVAFHSVYLTQSARKDSGGQKSVDILHEHAAEDDGVGQHHLETQSGAVGSEGDGASQACFETQITNAGPYRQLYDAKKAEYLERAAAGEAGWTKKRADRAAKRYAEKRLLRDLWVAWTRDVGHRQSETHAPGAGEGDRGGQARLEARRTTAAPVAKE